MFYIKYDLLNKIYDSSSIISDDLNVDFIEDIEETEKINKIDIIKILKEENNINIFNIDSLHYYYDDLFSYNNDTLYNNYKIKDLVNKHLSLLDDEIEKNEVFYLNNEKVKYRFINGIDKLNLLNNLKLEKNIEIYNNIINDITNNILVYSSTNNKNLKDTNNTLINLYKREFYLSELKIPEDCILHIKKRYINVENESLISKLKISALHGMSKDAWSRFSDEGYKHYKVEMAGFKYNMPDIQAAIGIHQLKKVKQYAAKRERRTAIRKQL